MTLEVVCSDSNCPLCGEPNNCAMSASKPCEDCWCKNTVIDATTLKEIPAELQGKVCICQACATNPGKPL